MILFVVIGISVMVSPPSTGSRPGVAGGITVLVVAIALFGVVFVRLRTAFTVELRGDTLIYRTLTQNTEFDRSDVASIGISERNLGIPKILMPHLELRDGRTVWLQDMGQGKLITPDSTMQRDLVNAVTSWISGSNQQDQ
jgi:hypothetical protein